MARDAVGWEWGHAKALRTKHKREALLRREHQKLLVSQRAAEREAKNKSIDKSIVFDIEITWNMGGSGGDTFYVYALQRLPIKPEDKVRYVGATDDPRRRFLEHKRCGRLGDSDFRMIVVGRIKFPVERWMLEYNYRQKPNAPNKRRLRDMRTDVRRFEVEVANLYRRRGFELMNAD
jgi:hypothetical protein